MERNQMFSKSFKMRAFRIGLLLIFFCPLYVSGQTYISLKTNAVTTLQCDEGTEGWSQTYLGTVVPGGSWGGKRTWTGTTQYYWMIEVPVAGDYQFNLLAAVRAEESNISMKISSEKGGEFSFYLNETRGFVVSEDEQFERIPLSGKLSLPAGKQWIAIESNSVPTGKYVMNFRTLEMIPVKDLAFIDGEAARAKAARANIQWMRDAVYGGMFHWTSQSVNQQGISISFDQKVANFNVEQFAVQAQQMGLGYVLFTCGHGEPYVPAPLASWEKWWPNHTTQRDLIMELADALLAKGIKLMIYIPSHVVGSVPNGTVADFENSHVEILTEMGNRYGNKIMGYWFDGWYFNLRNYPAVNIERIYNSTKVGNPNRATCFSTWELPSMTEWQDYWGGEVAYLGPIPTSNMPSYGPAKGIPAHLLVIMEDNWVMSNTSVSQLLSAQAITNYVAAAQRVNVPVTINMTPYADGTVLPVTLQAMVALKNTIKSTVIDGNNFYNDTYNQITYSGSWSYSNSRGFADFNDDVHSTTTNGDYCEFSFTGNGIDLYSEKNNDQGDMDIYIDNVFQSTVSCYNGSRLTNQIIFQTSLPIGAHTLKAVKKSGQYMVLDGYMVLNHVATALNVNSISSLSDLFSIFPNPTTGKVALLLDDNTAIVKIEIIDMAGKVVYEKSKVINQISLDITNFPNGIYLVKVTTDKGVVSQKIIKQ